MPSHRRERLSEDFRRELSRIISGMKDPRLSEMLSVTRVEVTSDLSFAKVHIGAVSGSEAAREACALLRGAAGHVKTELARSLKVRKIPELNFVPDESVDYYTHISTILEGLGHDKDN